MARPNLWAMTTGHLKATKIDGTQFYANYNTSMRFPYSSSNVIEYLYSSPSRYLLRTGLYNVKCHHERICFKFVKLNSKRKELPVVVPRRCVEPASVSPHSRRGFLDHN